MSACRSVSPRYPERSVVLTVLVGLLASTGLRSGEARRLDRADVDLGDGVLHIRRTKFRKDRLVPVHATTLAALPHYAGIGMSLSSSKGCSIFSQLARQPAIVSWPEYSVQRSLQARRLSGFAST